jgi:hypothetical protein
MAARNRSAMPASWQFTQLQRDLHKMGTEQRKRLRSSLMQVGQAAHSDARSRAGAWSKRIPSAITLKPYMHQAQGRVGVELRVSRRVPHARAYEGISQQGSLVHFRHPVYGNREAWVSQQTRPYLWPAVQGRRNEIYRAVDKLVQDAARESGFR